MIIAGALHFAPAFLFKYLLLGDYFCALNKCVTALKLLYRVLRITDKNWEGLLPWH